MDRKIINPSSGYPPDEIRFVANEHQAPLPVNEMNTTPRKCTSNIC